MYSLNTVIILVRVLKKNFIVDAKDINIGVVKVMAETGQSIKTQ